jgi:hypothetical protein
MGPAMAESDPEQLFRRPRGTILPATVYERSSRGERGKERLMQARSVDFLSGILQK